MLPIISLVEKNSQVFDLSYYYYYYYLHYSIVFR